MAAMSILLVTAFAIADSHLIISKNNNLHQEAYYMAESAMEFAIHELHSLIMDIHEECLSEFHYDPLRYPMSSLQENVIKHIENSLGPKINKRLIDMKLLNNFPIPEVFELYPDSILDTQIRFADIYQNPSRLLITSRAEIGKIRRRIDSEIHVNKVSNIYDSYLFDKAMLIGNNLCIDNGGSLESFGSIHVQGAMHGSNSSILHFHEFIAVREEINLVDGCRAIFNEDVICHSLYAEGEKPTHANINKDIYSYGAISAKDSGSRIQVNGKLYVNPKENSHSAGVSAINGSIIQLKNDVFINGTLQYEADSQYLFGMEHIPVDNGIYQSSESIGGGNQNFYFPEFVPEYAYQTFTPDFNNLTILEQGDLIHTYLNTLPTDEKDINLYLKHIEELSLENIKLEMDDLISGYTTGYLFANNKVIEPLHMPNHEEFFKNIKKEMELHTSWDYNGQLNHSILVPFYNVITEGNRLSILDSEQPIICIIPETKDLILPSGKFKGIIITNGSINVPHKAEIVFSGLMIAGKDVVVEGNLTLHENKELIIDLLNNKDASLGNYFRIKKEKPLIEIISCKEVSYNSQ